MRTQRGRGRGRFIQRRTYIVGHTLLAAWTGLELLCFTLAGPATVDLHSAAAGPHLPACRSALLLPPPSFCTIMSPRCSWLGGVWCARADSLALRYAGFMWWLPARLPIGSAASSPTPTSSLPSFPSIYPSHPFPLPHCSPAAWQVNPGQGERAYSDLDIVREFRAMANSAKRQERVAPRVSGWTSLFSGGRKGWEWVGYRPGRCKHALAQHLHWQPSRRCSSLAPLQLTSAQAAELPVVRRAKPRQCHVCSRRWQTTGPPCIGHVCLADEELKWLSWPEYLQLCSELRRECAGRDSSGRRRTDGAVAWSLQRYLVFAIFSCVPDRQVQSGRPRGRR